LVLEKLWSANGTKTQQSTVDLTVFVAVPIEEGVGGIGAEARWLNLLCGVRARSSVGCGGKISWWVVCQDCTLEKNLVNVRLHHTRIPM
jgi:hypothetical protein